MNDKLIKLKEEIEKMPKSKIIQFFTAFRRY